MKIEQAARQALVALEDVMADFDGSWTLADTAITALREALAEPKKPEECANGCPQLQVCDYCQIAEQPKQEPVAWFIRGKKRRVWWECVKGSGIPLYAATVRTKDLTDDEINELWLTHGQGQMMYIHEKFARAVIAADREKNK